MTKDVLFNIVKGVNGDIGVINLNRPNVLNSLNHDMIMAIKPTLDDWAVDDSIKAVVIKKAEGRAFCAGGDLKLTYERAKNDDPAMTEFFFDEYHLNKTIYHYPKPYIAILDGITMGGGVGLSIHGSHKVATENLLFAMPETGIGFFPDVGGTCFLPRLPGQLGIYLGLTGARIKSDDATGLGLVNATIASATVDAFIDSLSKKSFDGDANKAVDDVIEEYSQPCGESALLAARSDIDAAFSAATVEKILENLEASDHDVCQSARKMLSTKSPTSLKVTLRALSQGCEMDFDACMQLEFRLVSRFLQEHDFIEGIRAVIIDKDQSPTWQPAKLSEVHDSKVENYFTPVEKELA